MFPFLPPPHPSTTLTPLFGVPPNAHARVLHDLYALQVGAIVFAGGMGSLEGVEKPVVLGIALKGASGDEDGGVSEEDRKCFGEVMEMVSECRVWSVRFDD
ncbi:hypothetical protein MNV49_001733 [Pseudohyphozyma bogoriensis]|nr:hypothetical protein MNV49_001733 [Pseudohyphozyma bogoriensis]